VRVALGREAAYDRAQQVPWRVRRRGVEQVDDTASEQLLGYDESLVFERDALGHQRGTAGITRVADDLARLVHE
jgi:hypothetical protein